MKPIVNILALSLFGVLLLASCASQEKQAGPAVEKTASIKTEGKSDVEIGRELFAKHTCEGCHANGGNIMAPNAPIKGKHFLEEFPTDDKIVKVVREGIPETPMQGFSKEELSDSDLNYIIAYIRSLTPTAGTGKVEENDEPEKD